MRTSVCRTIPAIGGGTWDRPNRTTAAMAVTRVAITAITVPLRGARIDYSFPRGNLRRTHRQGKIQCRQDPQPGPVSDSLGQGRVHLIDAHQPIDRRGAGENEA